jgi:hypothetical protein
MLDRAAPDRGLALYLKLATATQLLAEGFVVTLQAVAMLEVSEIV